MAPMRFTTAAGRRSQRLLQSANVMGPNFMTGDDHQKEGREVSSFCYHYVLCLLH